MITRKAYQEQIAWVAPSILDSVSCILSSVGCSAARFTRGASGAAGLGRSTSVLRCVDATT